MEEVIFVLLCLFFPFFPLCPLSHSSSVLLLFSFLRLSLALSFYISSFLSSLFRHPLPLPSLSSFPSPLLCSIPSSFFPSSCLSVFSLSVYLSPFSVYFTTLIPKLRVL